MQNKRLKKFENRAMTYATRKYNDGLRKIKKEQKENNKEKIYDLYDSMKPVTSCWILNYDYDNENKELLRFRMLEETIHKNFGENIKIMLLSLKAKHKSTLLEGYELLSNAKSLEELQNLRTKKQFTDIIEDMEYYNMDEETYQKMERNRRMKERYEDDLIFASAEAYHEGKNEGTTIGKKRGISIGEKRGKIKLAKDLLNAGVDISLITKFTGFSEQQIKNY